jgi:hypothetical protein
MQNCSSCQQEEHEGACQMPDIFKVGRRLYVLMPEGVAPWYRNWVRSIISSAVEQVNKLAGMDVVATSWDSPTSSPPEENCPTRLHLVAGEDRQVLLRPPGQ